jgi:ribonuclease P protein component
VRDRDTDSGFIIERLKRRSDFRAMASGVRTSGGAFALQARARGDEGAVRIGFTVSRQVGGAVERNRVRRRLREMVRVSAAAGGGGLRAGHDYVLIGRRGALAAPFGEMLRDLDAALRRVHAQFREQVRDQTDVSERPGTGGGRSDALHEAGSPPRPPGRRRNRNQSSPASSARLPQER